MMTDLRLLRDEAGIWARVPGHLASQLRERFDQLIFSEDVRVTDESDACDVTMVVGEGAAAAVASATGASEDVLRALPVWGHVVEGQARVIRTDDTLLPTFEVWTPKTRSEAIFKNGLRSQLFDALRIEAGRPVFGVDMDTDTIPLEAGLLDRAISQTKGCYVGQEVIVRVLHRGGGRVARRLMKVAFDPAVVEAPATPVALVRDGKTVGTLTSAARSVASGRVIGLGYVTRDLAEIGGVVETAEHAVARLVGFAG
jgi:folate-binding protein YgfZ